MAEDNIVLSLNDRIENNLKEIYDNEIDSQFLNQYTRYGRNALLNLCEDYALHIYEKLYFINKKNTVDYIRYETKEENNQIKYKLVIPLAYKKDISFKSYKEFKKFISQNFYPLIEEFIKKGCDINCHTEEKNLKIKKKILKNINILIIMEKYIQLCIYYRIQNQMN